MRPARERTVTASMSAQFTFNQNERENAMPTMHDSETEVRTPSIATAGFLIAAGHEPLGITTWRDGQYRMRFAPDALADLHRFQAAKERAAQMFERAAQ